MNDVTMSRHSIQTGNLILVNGDHPYNEHAEDRDLVPADDPTWTIASGPQAPHACRQLIARRAAAPLNQLMRAIDGWSSIAAVSGWRPYQEQVNIWEESIAQHGLAFTRSYVAQPGCSEHHTGLAIDPGFLDGTPLDFIRPNFPYEGICQEFRDKAAAYGFVERYPEGKEALTGVAHEPWHFRYVGRPHAAIMRDRGFVLEEYLAFLRQFDGPQNAFVWQAQGQRWSIWYVEAAKTDPTCIHIDRSGLYAISGDNCNGFVVTTQLF